MPFLVLSDYIFSPALFTVSLAQVGWDDLPEVETWPLLPPFLAQIGRLFPGGRRQARCSQPRKFLVTQELPFRATHQQQSPRCGVSVAILEMSLWFLQIKPSPRWVAFLQKEAIIECGEEMTSLSGPAVQAERFRPWSLDGCC